MSELSLPDPVVPGMCSTRSIEGRVVSLGGHHASFLVPYQRGPLKNILKQVHTSLISVNLVAFPPDFPFCNLFSVSADLVFLEPSGVRSLPEGACLSFRVRLVGSRRPELMLNSRACANFCYRGESRSDALSIFLPPNGSLEIH